MAFFATRRFFPLFATQFLGAFNDNILKNALVVLVTYRLAGSEDASFLVTLAGGLFILPFFIFSATAGQLADKFDRARLTRIIKCVEIGIMLVATAGFYFEHATFLMFVLFAMGAHSAFFGPIKYALLPQHLVENELLAGNGYVESGTFLAILLGTILGGLLVMQEGGTLLVSACLVLVAVVGYTASRFIPAAPAPEPTLSVRWNIVSETLRIVRFSRENKKVFASILGISWFWLIGATLLAQFPPYTKLVLGGDETVVTLLYTAFSLGIGAGSLLCAKLTKGRITTRFMPYAAFFLSLFIADSYLASKDWQAGSELVSASIFLAQGGWRIAVDFTAAALCSGLFVVPLYAVMQHESNVAQRARIIAANNILNALFMVLSAVLVLTLLSTGMGIPTIFLCLAVLNLLTVWAIAHNINI